MKIYKYCPPTRKHLNNLKNSELYFQTPGRFDDIHDSNLPTKKIDFNSAVKQYEIDLNNFPIEKVKQLTPPKGIFEKNDVAENPSIDTEMKKFREKFVGITCFTISCNNKKLWKKFAKNSSGFCLGFETECDKDFFKGLAKVEYRKKLPQTNFLNPLERELQLNFLTKLLKYNFEEEIRLIKLQLGVVNFEKSTLKEIILGNKISTYNKKRIKKIVSENYGNSISVVES